MNLLWEPVAADQKSAALPTELTAQVPEMPDLFSLIPHRSPWPVCHFVC
jgi:hypothetical protein